MTPDKIQISFIGMEPTEAIKSYVLDKISKHENLWTDATKIEVFLKQNVSKRGVKNDFRIDINIFLPKAKVRVEEVGEDMYANIDRASDTLARRLKRYHDRNSNWEGREPWKVIESQQIEEDMEVEENGHYSYIPKIETRKQISDLSPIEEGEAIEKMELSGYRQLMFKNKETGKISMVYKREFGGYGLVEPADDQLI
jgi:putative sigma-54 modulation protein